MTDTLKVIMGFFLFGIEGKCGVGGYIGSGETWETSAAVWVNPQSRCNSVTFRHDSFEKREG